MIVETNRQTVFNLKADLPLSGELISQLFMSDPVEVNQKLSDARKISKYLFKASAKQVQFLEKQGTFHHLFHVITENEAEYFIKTNKALSPYRSYNFYTDQWIMHQLSNANLPAVRVLSVDCTRSRYPYDFIAMEKAQGQPLATIKENLTAYRNNITRLGVYLANIHSIAAEKFGMLDGLVLHQSNQCRGVMPTWDSYIYTNFEAHLNYCVSHGIFDSSIKNEIYNIFMDCHHEFDCLDSRLLQGDLNDYNVFVDEDDMVIIDWEDALAGDPVFDIALWGTFINHHENLDALLKGYRTILPFPERFMLRYWLYYLRIIIAKTVLRQRFNYYKTDLIPALDRIHMPLNQIKQLIQDQGL